MNGETGLACPKMIRAMTSTSMPMMGAIHQAFLTLRKSHNSPMSDLLFPM